ncbi:MAG: hypothetical protein J6X81_06250 [Muribaculaceae bacterium]|nr:hypothetical protein [Muribaculaceae bacterium]
MRKTNCKLFLAVLLAIFSQSLVAETALSESTFRNPEQIQTSCYWYWISDNISEQGVINDLKTMKEQGITRAFIGHQGVPNVPRGDVKFQTERWWHILHTALKTASELGIEIGLFNGPGWSHMGGPWVKPEQSMRYLASQRVDVTSNGETINAEFLTPSDFLNNVRVLAFPRKFGENSVASGEVNLDLSSTVNLTADNPFTLRSLKIYHSGPFIADVTVRVKDGEQWRDLKSFRIFRQNMTFHTGYDLNPPVAEGFPDVTGKEFQVEFRNRQGSNIIPSVEISDEPVISRYIEKVLARMHETPAPQWTEYKWAHENNYPESEVVAESDVVDITDCLTDEHHISWYAPKGNWTIIRTYMAPTNILCDPTFEDSGQGLEVDRWSRESLKAHYDAYMGEVMRRIPAEERSTWKVVVCDSYEMATQNFGDDFFPYFESRYGYDPTPYLLTYSGIVVGSDERSERFLWDLRRMIADRLAQDNIGAMDSLARADGKHLWLENYGHWGFPGEFLNYGSLSSEVAGEFWSTGTLGDIENRAATSCAHIYGKNLVSSESFTYGGPEFVFSPRDMKARGDKFFSEGINNTLLHLYVSQTNEDSIPGMIPWFGNEFNRKNTWYSHLSLFTDYLKRCNYMLRQGTYVADVAYFIGDDTPVMTGITEPEMPSGRQFDYVNAEVLIRDAQVNENHEITLPHGNRYKLLVLPPCATFRPETLNAVKRLVEQGAVVLATSDRPTQSPSMQNYPACDEQVSDLAIELWGYDGTGTLSRRVGKGYFLRGYDIEGAIATHLLLGDRNVGKDFAMTVNGADATTDEVLYSHLRGDAQDIYFIANQTEGAKDFSGVFRQMKGRRAQLWNPIDGSRRDVTDFGSQGADAVIPLRLNALETVFVVFDHETAVPSAKAKSNYPTLKPLAALNGKWDVKFRSNYGDNVDTSFVELKDWTELTDPVLKYFSGHGIYSTTFKLKKMPKNGQILLDLGEVDNTCRVKVNGVDVGGAWTAPYVIDISGAAVKGINTIEIDVANNFMNREIGDKVNPSQARLTSNRNSYESTSPLQPSGLKGPVQLLLAQ